MANKRIYQLETATDLTDKYIGIDKSGNPSAEKYPLENILSLKNRFNTFSVDSGEQTITFLTPFPDGTVYGVESPVGGLTTGSDIVWAYPYAYELDGFKVNFSDAVTGTYTANPIQ